MDASDQAAEQFVRITLAGSEVALRLSGAGAKNIAAALFAAASNTEQTKGKARLSTLLKSGKELKVFQIKEEQLKDFAAEAKRYGVLYVVVRQNSQGKNKTVDLMVKAEDASKLNRIIDKLELGKVSFADSSVIDAGARKQTPSADREPKSIEVESKDAAERLIDDVLAKPLKTERGRAHDPLVQTRKDETLSELISGKNSLSGKATTEMSPRQNKNRESLRKRMREIEERRARETNQKTHDLTRQQNIYEQPAKTKQKATPEKGL